MRHVDQEVLDARLATSSPIGLESPADPINAAGHVQIQTVKIEVGLLAHDLARD